MSMKDYLGKAPSNNPPDDLHKYMPTPKEPELLPCPKCHEGATYTLRVQVHPWAYSCGVCGTYIGTFQSHKRYCENPDDCEYVDCPTAFCDRNTRTPQPPSQDAIKKAAEMLYNNRGAVAHYKKEELEQILNHHLNSQTK